MSKCDTCKMSRLCDELERMGKVPKHENCRCYTSDKPQTNADRIRSMSDEELAAWLVDLGTKIYNARDWLDWLRREVEDGNS